MADRYVIFGATYDGDGTTSSEATGATVTITIATPGVVAWTAHGLANNTVVYLETTGALPTGLNGTTKYYVRNAATNTLELSLTSGGASIATSGTQSGTHYASTAGAWRATNSTGATLTALVGTINHGTLAAGDWVYIRSKTGNGANANISYTLPASVTLGSASGTLAAPVTWVLDNGGKWSGQNGTLTLQDGAATNYVVTLRDNNNFISSTKWNWIIKAVNTSANNSALLVMGQNFTDGLFVDANISSTAGRAVSAGGSVTKYNLNKNFKFANSSRSFSGVLQNNGVAVFENIEWEVTYDVASSNAKPLVYSAGGTTSLKFIGGRVFGAGCTSSVSLISASSANNSGHVAGVGFSFPIAMMLVPIHYTYTAQNVNTPISFIGADAKLGAVLCDKWGQVDSRDDGNYPKLNSVLPDSGSSPWSWRLWPYLASGAEAANFTVLNGVYSDTAAAKTITLEVLISNTITTCTKENSWIDVIYTDNATGLQVCESSRDLAGGALAAGSTSWNSTTWGVVACTAKALSLTTSGSIKQNTQVIVVLNTAVPGTGSSDVWFVDGTVTLS